VTPPPTRLNSPLLVQIHRQVGQTLMPNLKKYLMMRVLCVLFIARALPAYAVPGEPERRVASTSRA
jgi:hypothetical protein